MKQFFFILGLLLCAATGFGQYAPVTDNVKIRDTVSGTTTLSASNGSLKVNGTSLGSAAFTSTGEYATAAQGVKADSALQPNGNGSGLTGITPIQIGAVSATTGTATAFTVTGTGSQTFGIKSGSNTVRVGAVNAYQATSVIPGATLVGAGDSLLSGYKAVPGTSDPLTFLSQHPAFTGRIGAKVNTATAGWKLSDLVSDYNTHVRPYSPSVTGTLAYLVIQVGTNDFEVSGTNASTWMTAYESYMTTAKNDGFIVVACTVPPMLWDSDQTRSWYHQTRTSGNSLIRRSLVPDIIADVEFAYDTRNHSTDMDADRIHPNASGCQKMANWIAASIVLGNLKMARPTEFLDSIGMTNELGYSNTWLGGLLADRFAGYYGGGFGTIQPGLHLISGTEAKNGTASAPLLALENYITSGTGYCGITMGHNSVASAAIYGAAANGGYDGWLVFATSKNGVYVNQQQAFISNLGNLIIDSSKQYNGFPTDSGDKLQVSGTASATAYKAGGSLGLSGTFPTGTNFIIKGGIITGTTP